VLSLLALGDTGRVQHPIGPLSGQWIVAKGLVREDQRCPADALVLLGDNFYPRGLEARELPKRLRQNLVAPYCRFVSLEGERSVEVEAACALPRSRRHVVPIWAVLGNHDYVSPESPSLQRDAVPEFVPNWRVSEGKAELVDLGEGVSIVFYDPEGDGDLLARDPAPVVEALRAAPGPWRILASHYPVPVDPKAPDTESDVLAGPVRRAVEQAGVPVQLALAGHEHSLYAVDLTPERGLQVVVGSGGQLSEADIDFEGTLFKRAALGFARVDLVRDAEGEHLVATLFETPEVATLLGAPARPVARYRVDVEGRVRTESLPTSDAADAADGG